MKVDKALGGRIAHQQLTSSQFPKISSNLKHGFEP